MQQSIDEIWKSMNNDSCPKAFVSCKLSKKPESRRFNSQSDVKKLLNSRKKEKEYLEVESSNNENIEACDEIVSSNELISIIKRDINGLGDERITVRKHAIETIHKELFIRRKLTPEVKKDIFSVLSKALMKRFGDPVEKVRQLSMEMFTQFVEEYEDLIQILPYVFPVLMDRISRNWHYDEKMQVFIYDAAAHSMHLRGRVIDKDKFPVNCENSNRETSEEMRFLRIRLLDTILRSAIRRKASSLLNPYFFDSLVLLVDTISDPYHEVNIISCGSIQFLSENFISAMKYFAVALVRHIKPLLTHRIGRVRQAGLKAVWKLVLCPNIDKCKGAGTEAIADLIGHVDENVVPIAAFYRYEVSKNTFAQLDQDANLHVRYEFYKMIASWLSDLLDRYDYESRLIPYLVSAVNDEVPEISAFAVSTIEDLGRRYESEHSKDVLVKKQYGVDGDVRCNHTKSLPPPFVKRPSIGARLYIRGKCRRYINPVLKEIRNWKTGTKLHAVRLLKCIVIYSEEHITMDIHEIIRVLLNACHSDEIGGEILEITELIGRFVNPDAYLPLILPHIEGRQDIYSTSTSYSNDMTPFIDCLNFLISGSLEKEVLPHANTIVNSLCTKSLLETKQKKNKESLLSVTLTILRILDGRGRDVIQSIYRTTGRLDSLENLYCQLFKLLIALEVTYPKEVIAGFASLCRIRRVESNSELYGTLIQSLFPTCLASYPCSSLWKPESLHVLLFNAFIRNTPKEMLRPYIIDIMKLLKCIIKELSSSEDSDICDTSCNMIQDLLQAKEFEYTWFQQLDWLTNDWINTLSQTFLYMDISLTRYHQVLSSVLKLIQNLSVVNVINIIIPDATKLLKKYLDKQASSTPEKLTSIRLACTLLKVIAEEYHLELPTSILNDSGVLIKIIEVRLNDSSSSVREEAFISVPSILPILRLLPDCVREESISSLFDILSHLLYDNEQKKDIWKNVNAVLHDLSSCMESDHRLKERISLYEYDRNWNASVVGA